MSSLPALALLLAFADPSPEAVFAKRIRPIFDSPNPSSGPAATDTPASVG